ncbi:helix-turn-helix domain-containing protein [Dokdonia sp.]|uniref:helix-turn-helix domain-containing protein n=1 Tax=Dokdonia sp. TaxID=2024995 RepID=UPI003263E1B0
MQLIKNITRALLIVTLFCGISSFTSLTIDPEIGDVSTSDFQLTQGDNYKRESIKYTKEGKTDLAVESIRNYILATGDFSILEGSAYESINNSKGFEELKDKYIVDFSIISFLYLYVGLIGIFIALVLNLRKRTDRVANALIGFFVLMHSFFLIHTTLYTSHYTLYHPHTQNMSTMLSFLYGPILYFYFKRITENYSFKKSDLLHLLPTLGFIIVFIPIYSLSAEEKLKVMLGVGQYDEHPYLNQVAIIKLTSLMVYGYYTLRLYLKNVKKSAKVTPKKIKLQKMIMIIHGVYAISYTLYAINIMTIGFEGVIFDIQFFAMATLVLYVGYIAYANPQVLVGTVQALKKEVVKYKNSGLTTSFSTELKEELVRLLEVEKVYRQNSIKLETIAERLGTTRHNASQVINEHFDLNFFELINKYRVEEAMELLKSNKDNLNIIDIAYEVGYNNKVTFNKSFKRFSNLTPSQFMKLERGAA